LLQLKGGDSGFEGENAIAWCELTPTSFRPDLWTSVYRNQKSLVCQFWFGQSLDGLDSEGSCNLGE
jgi:hypothetical protein